MRVRGDAISWVNVGSMSEANQGVVDMAER
jgi:hypothetical protein